MCGLLATGLEPSRAEHAGLHVQLAVEDVLRSWLAAQRSVLDECSSAESTLTTWRSEFPVHNYLYIVEFGWQQRSNQKTVATELLHGGDGVT